MTPPIRSDWLLYGTPWDSIHSRALSGEGITYYPRQSGGARKADSDGFVANCPVSNVHELALVILVIRNNVTAGMDT